MSKKGLFIREMCAIKQSIKKLFLFLEKLHHIKMGNINRNVCAYINALKSLCKVWNESGKLINTFLSGLGIQLI